MYVDLLNVQLSVYNGKDRWGTVGDYYDLLTEYLNICYSTGNSLSGLERTVLEISSVSFHDYRVGARGLRWKDAKATATRWPLVTAGSCRIAPLNTCSRRSVWVPPLSTKKKETEASTRLLFATAWQ